MKENGIDSTIEKLVDKLILLLNSSEEIRFYKQAEEKIFNSKSVQDLIEKIKLKQKEIVNAEHYNLVNLQDKLVNEINDIQNNLNNLPIVIQYQQAQVDANKLIQIILAILNDELTKKLY